MDTDLFTEIFVPYLVFLYCDGPSWGECERECEKFYVYNKTVSFRSTQCGLLLLELISLNTIQLHHYPKADYSN